MTNSNNTNGNNTKGKIIRCSCGNVLGVQTDVFTSRHNGRVLEVPLYSFPKVKCEKCGLSQTLQFVKPPHNEILQETHVRNNKIVFIITSDPAKQSFFRYDLQNEKLSRTAKASSPYDLYFIS